MARTGSTARWAGALVAVVLVAVTVAWFGSDSPAPVASAPAPAVAPKTPPFTPSVQATAPAPAAPPRPAQPAQAPALDEACLARRGGRWTSDRNWPPELDVWSARLAERLQGSGEPTLMAIELSVGDPARHKTTAWLDRVHAVARAAILSPDPVFYALALGSCEQRPQAALVADSPCDQLSHAQLTRLAPDNALTWLEQSVRERLYGDPVASLEALHRASVAPQREPLAFGALRLLVQTMPADIPSWARYALAQRWMDQRRLTRLADLMASVDRTELCRDADSNRRELCDALVRNLMADNASLPSLDAGLAIAANALKWSDERQAPFLRRLQAEHRAWTLMPSTSEALCGDDDHALSMLRALVEPGAPPGLLTEDVSAAMDRRERRRWKAVSGEGRTAADRPDSSAQADTGEARTR